MDLLSDVRAHTNAEAVTAELLRNETKAQLIARAKALDQGLPPQGRLKITQRMRVTEIRELLADYFGVILEVPDPLPLVTPAPTLPSTLAETQHPLPTSFSPHLHSDTGSYVYTGPHAHTDPDANATPHMDPYAYTGPHSHAGFDASMDPHPHPYAHMGPHSHTGPDMYMDPRAHPYAFAGPRSRTVPDMYTDPHAHPYAYTSPYAHTAPYAYMGPDTCASAFTEPTGTLVNSTPNI